MTIIDFLVVNAPQSSALSTSDKAKAEALVLNFLIDKAKVETNALFEDSSLARDAVYGNQQRGIPKAWVRTAFSMDGMNFSVSAKRERGGRSLIKR